MAMNQSAVVKLVLSVIGLCIAASILGPPIYWHFKEGLAVVTHSCSSFSSSSSSFVCDCSSQPLLSLP
ncbi:hypothetical protein M5689_011469 [Euphorbia peplus]|nr:hypothetical protein M5689_011469 [Euphorbia peplus]